MVYFFITALVSWVTAKNCTLYQCDVNAEHWASYDGTTDTYTTGSCHENNHECIIDKGIGHCRRKYQDRSWPGEVCDDSYMCAYGDWVNYICVGQGELEKCSIDDECDPGLYCGSDNEWERQFEEGEYGCTNDFACQNWLGCDHIPGQTGQCIPYHSVEDHHEVQFCGGINQLCSSTIWGTRDGKNYCAKNLESLGTFPVICTNPYEITCQSNTDNWFEPPLNLKSQCKCGYNSKGTAYWPVYPGDWPAQLYISNLKRWYRSELSQYWNTARRHSKSCLYSFWDYDDFVAIEYYYLYQEYFHRIEDTLEWVVAITYPLYYEYKLQKDNLADLDDEYIDDGSMILAFLSLTIIII